MEAFIIKLITMSLQGSVAIIVVIIARFIFGLLKIPKNYAYLLWIIPFIRLAVPFALESPFSIMPDTFNVIQTNNKVVTEGYNDNSEKFQDINGNGYSNELELQYYYDVNSNNTAQYSDEYYEEYNYILENSGLSGEEAYENSSLCFNEDDGLANEINPDSEADLSNVVTGNDVSDSSNTQSLSSDKSNKHTYPAWTKIFCLIWYIGVAVFIIYSYISYVRLKNKLEAKVLVDGNVYMSDYIDTGFVIGAFKPYICIPSDLEKDKQKYVVAHENYHIKRKDYIVKTIYFIITVVHWFNPFVWLAYFLMERDMEMSCDEAVLYELGVDNRKDYANTLFLMATDKRNPISMPIAFGEGSTKGRIKNIMKSRKPVIVLIAMAVVLIIMLGAVLLTDPSNKAADNVATQTDAGFENENIATKTDAELDTDNIETGTDAELDNENVEAGTDADLNNQSEGLKSGSYTMVAKADYVFFPTLILNVEKQEFTFSYDPLSSYLSYGSYEINDNVLVATSYDSPQMNYYTFNIIDGNKLSFVAEKSGDVTLIPSSEGMAPQITDGSIFESDDPTESEITTNNPVGRLSQDYPNGTEIEITLPEYNYAGSEEMSRSADGTILDYADMRFIIFHGYGVLYVYDRDIHGIRGVINLESIGCNYTQGDNACMIEVSNDGYRVYLTPMSGSVAYEYDVAYNQLYQLDKSDVKYRASFNPSLITDECVGNDYNSFQSYHCIEVTDINSTYYGYLKSGSGLWHDLTYVEENENGHRAFRLLQDYNEITYGPRRDAYRKLLEKDVINKNEKVKTDSMSIPPDYTLYEELIEKHTTAIEQQWDDDKMREEGLIGKDAGVYFGSYCQMDINDDGIEELLIGESNGESSVIYGIYTIKDGKVVIIAEGGGRNRYYLCEGNVLKNEGSNSASNSVTHFYYIAEGELVYIEGIIYDGDYSGKHPWYYTTTGGYLAEHGEPVVEALASQIVSSYEEVYIDFFNKFPAISGTIPTYSKEEDEAKYAYGEMLMEWENYPDLASIIDICDYSLCRYYDIDNDGVCELIIKNEKLLSVFKYSDNTVTLILSTEGVYWVILEDGMLMYFRPGGAPRNHRYYFYKYNEDGYEKVAEFVWYDSNEDDIQDEDDIYFYDADQPSMEDWQSLIAPYMEYEEPEYEDMFYIYND